MTADDFYRECCRQFDLAQEAFRRGDLEMWRRHRGEWIKNKDAYFRISGGQHEARVH
jgi:hypothetical protein